MASAGSSDLLLKGLRLLTTVVVTDAVLDLLSRQQPLRLGHGPLTVSPLRLDRVEPRALYRQPAGHNPHPSLALGSAVVSPDPGPHPLTDMPGGVVPDQQQRRLPLRRQ